MSPRHSSGRSARDSDFDSVEASEAPIFRPNKQGSGAFLNWAMAILVLTVTAFLVATYTKVTMTLEIHGTAIQDLKAGQLDQTAKIDELLMRAGVNPHAIGRGQERALTTPPKE